MGSILKTRRKDRPGVSIIIRRYWVPPTTATTIAWWYAASLRPSPKMPGHRYALFHFLSTIREALINFSSRSKRERERENFSQCPCVMHNKWKILQWLSSDIRSRRVSNWKWADLLSGTCGQFVWCSFSFVWFRSVFSYLHCPLLCFIIFLFEEIFFSLSLWTGFLSWGPKCPFTWYDNKPAARLLYILCLPFYMGFIDIKREKKNETTTKKKGEGLLFSDPRTR